MNIEFKKIPGYLDKYTVSNTGVLMSDDKILSQHKDKSGYLRASIVDMNKKRSTIRVHQLVAIAFLGHKPCGMERVIDHIDEDKSNNNLSNLRIVTHRFNSSRRTNGTSRHPGVYWNKRSSKWEARIRFNGGRKYLGQFTCEEEASKVYEKELHKINS